MADSVDIELEHIAHGGAAMGYHDGRAVFVPYTIPGERVRARIVEKKDRFSRAVPLEILRLSPARIEPRCAHFGPGGGGPCQWQHIIYPQQLEYKREIVHDQLERIGKLRAPQVNPVIHAAQEWEYRHYLTFSATRSPEDGTLLGFWNEAQRRVIPVDVCHLMHPALQELYYQLDLDSPGIRRVRFQMGSDPVDRMIIIETKDDLPPEIEVDFPLSINLLLSDNEPVNLIGSPQVTYNILGRTFRVTAGSYFHPDAAMIPALVEEVLSRLALTGGESVLELYSGVGTLTAFLAERADVVLSVESYPPAVTDAEENTADLEDNIDLVEGPAEAVLEDVEAGWDAVVVDPPPSGLSDGVIAGLAQIAAPRIVYVSSDPASLARDAQNLSRHSYRLGDVQPIDLDPQTSLITCVTTLTRT